MSSRLLTDDRIGPTGRINSHADRIDAAREAGVLESKDGDGNEETGEQTGLEAFAGSETV